nr:hypothetical protein [uncultured Comamonas sp.]
MPEIASDDFQVFPLRFSVRRWNHPKQRVRAWGFLLRFFKALSGLLLSHLFQRMPKSMAHLC